MTPLLDRAELAVRNQLAVTVMNDGTLCDADRFTSSGCHDIACAVLRELQNPSDAMAEAGAKAAWENVIDADAHALRIIFAAMIDAALFDGA